MSAPPPRLPFTTPRRLPASVLIAVAAAAGSGAALGLTLMREVPAGVVPLGCGLAAALSAAGARLRSPRHFAIALPVLFVACALGVVALVLMLRGFDLQVMNVVAAALGLSCVFAMLFGPLIAIDERTQARPGHDRIDRVLVRVSAWLAVVAGGSALLGALLRDGSGRALGRGGLSWALQAVALLLGAAMAAAALARDRGRLRWLARVRAGALPAWGVTPRSEIKAGSTESPPLLPYLAAARRVQRPPNGALVARAAEGAAPFRQATAATAMAWIPLDQAAVTRALGRRMAVAVFLLAAQGPGGLWIGGAWAAHLAPLRPIAALALGQYHSCALLADGAVHCWGRNIERQLGGGTDVSRYSPQRVEGLPRIRQIAAGRVSTCALTEGGRVACWGGIAGSPAAPFEVPDLSSVVRIAAGQHHACALREDGKVLCWGSVEWGGWDKGRHVDRPVHMVLPEGDAEALDFASGQGWTCLSRTDGLFCWDRLPSGDSNATSRGPCTPWHKAREGEPARAKGPGTLAVSDDWVCQVLETGDVWCWGRVQKPGEMGGTPACERAVPVKELRGVRRLGITREGACALDAEGALRCHGRVALHESVDALRGVVDFTVGHSNACAVREDGTAHCWGRYNDHGELGDGTRRESALPVVVRR